MDNGNNNPYNPSSNNVNPFRPASNSNNQRSFSDNYDRPAGFERPKPTTRATNIDDPIDQSIIVNTQIQEDILSNKHNRVSTRTRVSVFSQSVFTWSTMWIAIGFSIITIISAILLLVCYKNDYRPKEVGWSGFAPVIVISIIWAIINLTSYWFLDEDNHALSIVKYVTTITTFTAITWWVSFAFLFPDRYAGVANNRFETPIDPTRAFSFVIPLAAVAIFTWGFWAVITFVPSLQHIGSWTVIGIGTAMVIVPSIIVFLSTLFSVQTLFTIEYMVFGSVIIGVLLILYFIFYLVMNGHEDDPIAGIYWGEWVLASYLIVLVVLFVAIIYLVRWIIKMIADH